MFEAFTKILPILLIFALGYLLKKTNSLKAEDGGLLLKLCFYVGSPALTYLSVSQLKMAPELLVFPAAAVLTTLTLYGVDLLVVKRLSAPRETLGVYMTGTLIANTSFVLPFLLAVYGPEAVGRLAMYDLASGFLIFAFVYSIAIRYGDREPSATFIVRKILISPPIWGLLLGLVANFTHFTTPSVIETVLQNLAATVSPLVMLAMGLAFSPQLLYPRLLSLGLLTRMVGGMVIGLALAVVLGLSGVDRMVVILCAGAPIGFTTLTFATMEKLDTRFAASLLSVAIGIGLVLTPFLTIIGT